MKISKIISLSVIGFSLAFASAAFIASNSHDFKVAKADPAASFYIGNHSLAVNETYVVGDGSAKLRTDSTGYVLTLNNFNNGGEYYSYQVVKEMESFSYSSALSIFNLDNSLTIEIIGNNVFHNGDTTTTATHCGLYISSTAEDIVINFTGAGEGLKELTCTNADCQISYGIALDLLDTALTPVNVSRCKLTAKSAEDGGNLGYGIFAPFALLNVYEYSDISATTGDTIYDSNYHVNCGIYVGSYHQYAGNVYARAGASTGATSNSGLKVKNGFIMDYGDLEALAGDTGSSYSAGIYLSGGDFVLNDGIIYTQGNDVSSNNTYGIYVNPGQIIVNDGQITAYSGSASPGNAFAIYLHANNFTMNGGSVFAYAYSSTSYVSMGVYSPTSSNTIFINEGAIYFKAVGQLSGTNMTIDGAYTGYKAPTTSIDTDPDVAPITPSDTPTTHTGKTILFQRFDYEAVSEPVTYDGNAHNALMVLVFNTGLTYTIEYQGEGQSDWSTTIPQYTNAKEYQVNFRLSGSLIATVEDSVTFKIKKANSSVTTAPTKVADFTADGQAHPLATAGVVEGGTIMYSVNDGDFSATIPTATNAGTYSVSYKVAGDANHDDTEPVSLGTVTVSAAPVPPEPGPTPVPPEPGPEPTPTPSDNGSGLPGWGIALIVVGSLLLACCAAIVLLFVFWPRYVVDNANKVIIRTILVFKKDDKVYLVSNKCKLVKAEKANVYKTKEDAEKALNK